MDPDALVRRGTHCRSCGTRREVSAGSSEDSSCLNRSGQASDSADGKQQARAVCDARQHRLELPGFRAHDHLGACLGWLNLRRCWNDDLLEDPPRRARRQVAKLT